MRVFVLISTIVLCSSCWSRKEINELALAVALGVDKVDNQYLVTVQVVNPSQIAGKGGNGQLPVTIFQARGNTELEAIRNINTISPRRIYASHIRMIVIGEELAKVGIKNILDLFSRGQEFRTDFYIAIAKGTQASKILEILTPIEKIPANKMFTSLKVAEKTLAPTVASTVVELISDLLKEGKHPVLQGIQIIGNQELGKTQDNLTSANTPGKLRFKGLAAFKDDKLVGWLDDQETKGYNFLINNIRSTIINIPCPEGGNLAYEIINSSTNQKGSYHTGKPGIEIEIRGEGNISEVNCSNLDLTQLEVIRELEKKINASLKKDIEKVIKESQSKLKIDIFGFGEVLHRSNLSYWEQVKDEWDETFISVPVKIKLDFKIRRIGTVTNPL